MNVFPLTAVDRVTEVEARRHIAGIKGVSLEEEYFRDHFPHFAVVPGVLILETCIQLGSWLLSASTDFTRIGRLRRVRALRFKKASFPGSLLHVHVRCAEWSDTELVLRADVSSDRTSCTEGEFSIGVEPA